MRSASAAIAGKRAAPRADDTHFVDDDWGEIDGIVARDSRFQNDRPARGDEVERRGKAGGRSGAVGDDIKRAGELRKLVEGVRHDVRAGERELGGMLANQVNPRTGEMRDPRAEQTKLAVSEDGEGHAGIQGNLFGDAKGGGKGFDEDRVNVVNGIGNVMKVASGDSDLVGHRAVGVGESRGPSGAGNGWDGRPGKLGTGGKRC